MKKIITYILFCCSTVSHAHAQQPHADSLKAVIQRQPADTNTVMAYFAYGEQYYPEQPDSAALYYKKGLTVAQQIHYLRGIARFTSYYINILNMRGEYSRGLHLATQAAVIYKALKDDRNLVIALNNIGNQHHEMANYSAAATHYLQALALAEKIRYTAVLNKLYNNLASIFLSMEDYEKSHLYASRACELARQQRDTPRIASALVNLGFAQTKLGRYHQGEATFMEVIRLGRYLGDSSYVMDGLINTGSIYSDMNQHFKALRQYEKTMQISSGYPDQDYRLYAQLGYGQELLKTGQPARADSVIGPTIELARKMQANDELRQTYLTAAEIKESLHQPAQALQYRKRYEALNDSLLGASTRKHVEQLEIAYQTAEKDKELAEKKLLLSEKDVELLRKGKWRAIYLLATALLAALALMIWLRYRHRRKLLDQQVQTLEKEKTVQVLEALMQGEEKERVRLSKDLHDGVGGLLSAVKMHFSAIRQEREMLRQDPAYAHAIRLLDDAIVDIRKTAHNLMPETLYRLGLKEAIQNFCNNISYSGTLQVAFYST
jgi:signal transduction histidine kinase